MDKMEKNNLSISITDDACENALLLHMVGQETQGIFDTLNVIRHANSPDSGGRLPLWKLWFISCTIFKTL